MATSLPSHAFSPWPSFETFIYHLFSISTVIKHGSRKAVVLLSLVSFAGLYFFFSTAYLNIFKFGAIRSIALYPSVLYFL